MDQNSPEKTHLAEDPVNGEKRSLLADSSAGSLVVLENIDAGRALRARLAALGIFPGIEMRVVRNGGHGPVVIAVNGSRVMIGRGEADRMSVRITGRASWLGT